MKFKRNLIGVLVAMTLNPAYADTASISGTGMGLLINEWVKAGVNANTGTLGSGGGTSPGLLYDPAGTGTFNPSYDYLTPGSPFDGFSLKVDSDNKTNNNTGVEQIIGQGVSLSNSNTTLTWSGSASYGGTTWNLSNAYTLAPNTPYINITTTIVAGSAASDVYYAKFIDPDSQGMPGDSSATDNVLGYGAIPSTNVAFSEATVSRYALGLYSAATNVAAGINGWDTDAASYINADQSCGTGVLYCNGDDTIGLTFHWTGVSAGDTLTASYAYIFGPSAFGAASSAVDGGAGGGTPGEVPGGGTLVDIGSATDAAASGGAPTVVSSVTDTEIISLSVSTPSYDYRSLAPTLALVGTSLVVTRENVTDTTTATRTTTNTTPITVDTYSDESVVSTRGTTTTTVVDTTALTTASTEQAVEVKVDTFANSQHLNLFTQEMVQPDPLSRINLRGDAIVRRSGVHFELDKNSWVWMSGKNLNGNDSRGNGFEVGYEKIWNDTTLVGVQLNQTNSKMTGVDNGSSEFDSTMLNVYAVKKLGRWAVKPMVGYETSDYDVSRTVSFAGIPNFDGATFTNKLSTKGKSYWADVQIIAPQVWKITPYAGLGIKRYDVDGATESGSEATALIWKSNSDTFTKPYVGARWDSETTERGIFYTVDARATKFNLEEARSKDGWTAVNSKYGNTLTSINSMVGYKLNTRSQVWAGYQYQHASEYNNSMFSIGGKIDF